MRFVANLFLTVWLLILVLDICVLWDLANALPFGNSVKLLYALLLLHEAVVLGPLANDLAKPPLHTYRNIIRHLQEGRGVFFLSATIFVIWMVLSVLGLIDPPRSQRELWFERLAELGVSTLPAAAWYRQFSTDRGEDSLMVNMRFRAVQEAYGVTIAFAYIWWALLVPWLVVVAVALRFYFRG